MPNKTEDLELLINGFKTLKYDKSILCVIVLFVYLFMGTIFAGDELGSHLKEIADRYAKRIYVKDSTGKQPFPIIAIDNLAAWPNFTLMKDGTIVALIYNQPAHFSLPGDLDCWASTDNGVTWKKRGTVAPRDTKKAGRGNVAAGLAHNGDLIAIVSGWSDPAKKNGWGILLPPVVCRSTDGGFTWTQDLKAFPEGWNIFPDKVSPDGYLIPFGDIIAGADGELRAMLYHNKHRGGTMTFCSSDDGKTWKRAGVLDKKRTMQEPAFFHLGKGKWILAARWGGLNFYTSDDDAKTWTFKGKLTPWRAIPAHFLRLKNGSILLSYGNRNPKGKEGFVGVDVMFSDDEGKTWSKPYRVLDCLSDSGYPSSVQLPDGQVLTGYYSRVLPKPRHHRYHMGVVTWDPKRTRKK